MPAPLVEQATQDQPKRVIAFRRAPRTLPAHLPRETIVHSPSSCNCPDCGSALRKLGEDVSEMLDFVPGYFKVIRHIRPKLSCAKCSRVVQQPAPSRPIERALPAPGLLAQVIVAKFADHCPLYRQQGIYRRSGVELERATLASWVAEAARLLEPLASRIRRYVLTADKVHADDTPVPVLDPGRGRTKTGRLWTYVRDDRPAGSRAPPAVWYRYSADRKGLHPREHLHGFEGILQADGYAGFSHCTRRAGSWRRPAGRTPGASSTTSTSPIARRLPPRRSGASDCCTRSSARSEANARPSAARSARRVRQAS